MKMESDHKIRNMIFCGDGLCWPLQLIVFGAVYYVTEGVTQIVFGRNLLFMLGKWNGNGSVVQLFYNIEDIIANVIICIALLFAFRIMNKDGQLSQMGLPGFSKQSALRMAAGFAVGAVSVSAVIAVQMMTGAVSIVRFAPDVWLPGFLAMFLSVGYVEEILTRGVLQHTLENHLGRAAAVLAPSVFFGVIHIGNANLSISAMINIILAGIFLALLTQKTQSLYAAIGFHTSWNFFQGNVFGLPVSGNDMSQSVIWEAKTAGTGPAWDSGGGFGPEGTIYCTAVYVLMILALLLYKVKLRND